MTPRERSDRQVVMSASQMDSALLSGVPPDVLAELVAARADWHVAGSLPTLSDGAVAALSVPAVAGWDEVFVRAARKQSVRP